MERDNEWLKKKLLNIWKTHFSDVDIINPIEIKFGQKSRTRFGSIRLRNREISRILINGYFKKVEIPEDVVTATVAHELVHYIHGFSSLHPRITRYPHKNGIVKKEMVNRGLKDVYEFEKRWSKSNWSEFIMRHEVRKARAVKPRRRVSRPNALKIADKFIKLFLQIYP